RFAAYGWQLEPADVQYDYHKHGSGICQSHRSDQFNDWLGAVDSSFNFVTIAIPLSGRGWWVGRLLDSILSQSFPLEYCSLLLYDNSCCDNFSGAISDWVGEHMRKFASLLYLQDMRTVNNRKPVDIADGPLDRNGLGGKVYGEDV